MKFPLISLSAIVVLGFSGLGHANDAVVQNYCQSLVQPGTPDYEAKQIVADCLAEQGLAASDEDAAMEQDNEAMESENDEYSCSQAADEWVQEQLDADPDADPDYQQFYDDCMRGAH